MRKVRPKSAKNFSLKERERLVFGRIWAYDFGVSEVTQILNGFGTVQSVEELLPLVYAELKRIAAHKMAFEAAGHTLQPTALVHEAWLSLAGGDGARFQ